MKYRDVNLSEFRDYKIDWVRKKRLLLCSLEENFAKDLVQHVKELIVVPKEVENEVVIRKWNFLGKRIDILTPEQEKYLFSSAI